MSSLQAACADNFYHPPDWDPRKSSRAEHAEGGRKHLSKEDKWKAHPLRERAKKLATEGILTIRFEMPYNVRCLGCGNHIAKGVRFNAEKKTIGKYLSTNILSFRFLCHCEDGTSRTSRLTNPHWIEIQTDPKNAEYVVAEGAVRVSDPALLTSEELGVEATLDSEEADKRSANPFYKLEAAALAGPVGAAAAAGGSGHGGESGGESGGGSGRIRLFGQPAGQQKPGQWLESLQGLRDADWEDDYEANRHLRKLHRSKRKSDLMRTAINQVKGIRIPLPEADHPEDIATSEAAPLHTAKRRRESLAASQPRVQLLAGSIFGGSTPGLRQGSHSQQPLHRRSGLRPPDEQEQERLRLVQLRHQRGMRITNQATEPSMPRARKGSTGAILVAAAGAPSATPASSEPQPPSLPPPGLNRHSLVAYSDSEDGEE